VEILWEILILVDGLDSSTGNSVKKYFPGWKNPFMGKLPKEMVFACPTFVS